MHTPSVLHFLFWEPITPKIWLVCLTDCQLLLRYLLISTSKVPEITGYFKPFASQRYASNRQNYERNLPAHALLRIQLPDHHEGVALCCAATLLKAKKRRPKQLNIIIIVIMTKYVPLPHPSKMLIHALTQVWPTMIKNIYIMTAPSSFWYQEVHFVQS